MPDARAQLKRQILSFLQNYEKQAFRHKDIAKRLNVRGTPQYTAFGEAIEELIGAGSIQEVKGGRVQHRPRHELHGAEGTLTMHPQGHGFVEVPVHGSFYIPPTRLGTALDGDWVRIALAADVANRPSSYYQEAEILAVVQRRRTEAVGTVQKMGAFAFVKSQDRRLHKDIYVDASGFNGASEGDLVVVSIDAYDDPKSSPSGRVLEVLGAASDPAVAIEAIARGRGVGGPFPDAVEEETAAISETISEDEIKRRLDVRQARTFTIDPVDAKDFDDAIDIERLDSGNYRVGVHIADVSHYVRQGTALDGEAYRRATSTYLVDRVIPMLPEKLSNKVCSLRPDEDKLAFSCIMEVSPRGAVKSYEIRETVIRSKQRFSYEEAQLIIEGGTQDHPFKDDVLNAAKLARTLTKKRLNQGAIDFDTTEIRIVLDEKGRPVDVIRKPRMDANRLIEEFMLLANKTVAEHVGKTKKGETEKPFVYRIHDRPDPEKIRGLRDYVRAFGYTLPSDGDGSVDRKALAALLQHVQDTPEQPVVTEAALRSMAKAVYDTNNIGHFGLGFKHYTHFTSPIRRYPDLIVHRLVKHYAGGGKGVSLEAIAEACDHCSSMEKQATSAERESIRLKQAEYVADHVGDTFDGVVKGVTKFGVFVEMTQLLTEGLVHVRDMNDDYYEFDQNRFQLTGTRKGKKYRLGDEVKVKVTSADVQSRKIDLVFV